MSLRVMPNIDGKCLRGKPKQRSQDTANADMKNAQLDPDAMFGLTRWRLLDPAPVGKNIKMMMMSLREIYKPFHHIQI